MIKAVIELGTNSSRLLIADIDNKQIEVLEKKLITTRLGEGVDSNKVLNKDAIARGLKAIKKFKEEIKKYEISKIKLAATSALREVNNGEKFKELIKKETDYNLEIISGKKEAELVYKGVNYFYDFDNFVIIDIGGGSTEFIWKTHNDKKINLKSVNIGAVRLTERFIKDKKMPMGKNIIDEISFYINKILKKEVDSLPRTNNLIGVGGTITTLASILLKLEEYDYKAIHNYILNYSEINKIINILRRLNLNKRKSVKGLNPKRADIIIPGIVILLEIMKMLRTLKLRVSDYDILYGLLIEA